jgi:hypothetical protein
LITQAHHLQITKYLVSICATLTLIQQVFGGVQLSEYTKFILQKLATKSSLKIHRP